MIILFANATTTHALYTQEIMPAWNTFTAPDVLILNDAVGLTLIPYDFTSSRRSR